MFGWAIVLFSLIIASVFTDNLSQICFFEVVRPSSLKYTYEVRRSRDIGTQFPTLIKHVRMVIAEPHHGCSPLSNADIAHNCVVLVNRGQCSFLTKTINVQNAGGLAIIVSDADKADDIMVDMVTDETGRVANIPALYLPGNHGHMLHRYLMYGDEPVLIDIPLNHTFTPLHKVKKPPWDLW